MKNKLKAQDVFDKQIFLISSPRSGSTWLANYIRSDPRIVYFQEIFSCWHQYMPHTLHLWQAGDCSYKEVIEKDLNNLLKYKMLFVGNIINRFLIFKLPVMTVIKFMASLLSRLGYKYNSSVL